MCLLGLFYLAAAQPLLSATSPTGIWKAEWITSPTGPQRDAAIYHFRKALDLSDVPKAFLVDVSADSRFTLYVNGARVGDGPANSDLAHWKYEKLNLSPYLHAGKNVIAATVWNFGINAPVSRMSSRTAFLLQSEDETQQTIDTGSSWKVEREMGHHALHKDYTSLLKGYYAAAPGEVINGFRHDWNWMAPSDPTGHGNAHWENARAIGFAASYGAVDSPTIWMLQPDPLPPMEYVPMPIGKVVRSIGVELPKAGDLSFVVKPHSKAVVLLDAGTMTTGYPAITLSGGANARVRVTYAEALVDANGNKGNRNQVKGRHIVGIYDEFRTDGGLHRVFRPLDWRAWRYMQLDITTDAQPLQVNNVTASFTAFPFQKKASFTSSDPELEKIWNVGWRTARLDAHETYMDTPYWERLQYVGDTRIQALISYVVAGDDRLARQAIDAIDDSRLASGLTQSRYPSSLPQIIPPFSLISVDMLHDFWMYRDDPGFVQSHLAGSRSVLDWFLRHQRQNGMIGKLPWWNFVDWTDGFTFGVPPQDKNGESASITLQFIEALRDGADLEQHLGNPARAAKYEQAANRASSAVWKLCWNSRAGLVADTPSQTHFSQQANVLAVWLNVVPHDLQKQVMKRILSSKTAPGPGNTVLPVSQASYYFRFYLARALESSGLGNMYIATLGPWRHMLALGLTTWAEKPEPTRSDSHAWSAHPTIDLLRIVAGIRPGSPDFSSIVIEPHLGSLQSVQASMPHPKGMIEVSFKRSQKRTDARIVIPGGVPAKLVWQGKTYPLHAGVQELEVP